MKYQKKQCKFACREKVCIRERSSYIDKISGGKTLSRPNTSGLAGGRSKAEIFETLRNSSKLGESTSSGGGATNVVRSTVEEQIWVVESHVKTPKKSAQEKIRYGL
jgi:hypothetical protein